MLVAAWTALLLLAAAADAACADATTEHACFFEAEDCWWSAESCAQLPVCGSRVTEDTCHRGGECVWAAAACRDRWTSAPLYALCEGAHTLATGRIYWLQTAEACAALTPLCGYDRSLERCVPVREVECNLDSEEDCQRGAGCSWTAGGCRGVSWDGEVVCGTLDGDESGCTAYSDCYYDGALCRVSNASALDHGLETYCARNETEPFTDNPSYQTNCSSAQCEPNYQPGLGYQCAVRRSVLCSTIEAQEDCELYSVCYWQTGDECAARGLTEGYLDTWPAFLAAPLSFDGQASFRVVWPDLTDDAELQHEGKNTEYALVNVSRAQLETNWTHFDRLRGLLTNAETGDGFEVHAWLLANGTSWWQANATEAPLYVLKNGTVVGSGAQLVEETGWTGGFRALQVEWTPSSSEVGLYETLRFAGSDVWVENVQTGEALRLGDASLRPLDLTPAGGKALFVDQVHALVGDAAPFASNSSADYWSNLTEAQRALIGNSSIEAALTNSTALVLWLAPWFGDQQEYLEVRVWQTLSGFLVGTNLTLTTHLPKAPLFVQGLWASLLWGCFVVAMTATLFVVLAGEGRPLKVKV